MTSILYLIPIALGLGLAALAAFAWAVANRQFRDPEGDGGRAILGDDHILSPEEARHLRQLAEDEERGD